MHVRAAPGALLAALVGCSDGAGPPAAATAASATAAPAPVATTGTIRGVVTFAGKAPERKVPAARRDADFCKTKPIVHNAVRVKDGKLRDTFVRLAEGSVMGVEGPPEVPAALRVEDCMFEPRIQGARPGQRLEVKLGDPVLHNLHPRWNQETLWGSATPKGVPGFTRELPESTGFLVITCDVHPWERSFLVVTDHPFFAVSGEDGGFRIEGVPAGRHAVEAWHARYGHLTREDVEVPRGGEVAVRFEYTDSMAEPPQNKGELEGLW